MTDLEMNGRGEATEERSRRKWMLLAAGLGAALVLSACGKNNKNKNDDDDEEPEPTTP